MQSQQKEIDLSKVIGVLKENKKRICQVTGSLTVLAIIYCIFATPIFTASAIINPPKLTDAGSDAAQALNGIFGFGGGGGGLLSKTDADITIAILKTNALKNLVIQKFDLQHKLDKKDSEVTRRTLDGMVKFIPDMKSGFVQISVDDTDPNLAAGIANYYSVALGQMISNIAYGKSSNKYRFYENQLAQAESSLTVAEDALKHFVESNGFVAGQQSEVAANLSVQLQAQLIVAQAKLQSMTLYATSDNPDYIELESQINGYKVQLDNINAVDAPDPIGIPANAAPRLSQQFGRLTREITLRQQVYKIITQQYEANRLDLLSELAPIGVQVVDPAVVPLYKSKPKRLFVVAGGFVFGLIASSVYFIIINRKKVIVEADNEKQFN